MKHIYLNLILNATLLITLMHLYSLIRRRGRQNIKTVFVLGILFGVVTIAGMNLPFHYNKGIIYDGRSIILSIAGLFGGWASTLIAVILSGIYRIYLGGSGIFAGVGTIFFCALAGAIFRELLKGKPEKASIWTLYLFGVCAHIIMLASQMLIQPFSLSLKIIKEIWLPVMIIFPLATTLIGLFLRNEEMRIKIEEDRDLSEEKIKRLNLELESEKERLENIIEATGIGTWEWNVKTGKTVFNERWAEMIGYSLEEISPTDFNTWVRFVHPDDLKKSNEILERHFRGEIDFYESECRLRHKDGQWIWILDRGRVIKRDEEGKPLIMFGSHIDISARKQMEEKIKEGERFLSTVIDNLPGFVYRCENDSDWTMLYLSEQVEAVTGYKLEELLGNRMVSYNDIIHPDFREYVKIKVDEALKIRGPYEIEYPIITKSGDTRWVWEKGRGIYDEEGGLICLEGFITDITEMKLKEEAYRESESKLKAVTDAAQDAIIMIDQDGKVTFWNPASERMFGYSEKEAMGRDVHELIAPNEHYKVYSKMFPEFTRTGEGPAVGKILELTTITRIGEEIPIELSLSAVQIKGDWHGLAVIRDITERKRAEEEKKRLEMQFLQAQKLESIGRLAGGVAHDFNNILSVIIGYGDIILNKLEQSDPIRDYVKQMVDAGKRAAGLTNQLLAFSRKQILRPRSLDLNELIKNLEKMLKRMIGEDIELRLILSDNIPDIYIDSTQMEQVIMNLAVNARDAMPQGGVLTIETSITDVDESHVEEYQWIKPGRYVLLTVSDTGEGIAEKDLENIFEPFFTTKETGTGLGLATVYGIIKQSGGNIIVESKDGSGTTFKIYLPPAEEMKKIEPDEERQEIPDGEGKHIMVVEDEETVRDLIQIALNQAGFKVTIAASGNEALELLERYNIKPDLLITDVIMPGMSGRVLVDRVKEIMPTLKIMYITGYTDDAILRHGLKDRKIPLLQKPFKIDDLILQIKKILLQEETETDGSQ
ncbi:MAG TPA: PAS domain S-box protein [Syntrophorhabdaceae bacterium]|nr:PAS domain S-box protein [Syntrophorhabdaceae bacterium]